VEVYTATEWSKINLTPLPAAQYLVGASGASPNP
jgi:hypothetical protein